MREPALARSPPSARRASPRSSACARVPAGRCGRGCAGRAGGCEQAHGWRLGRRRPAPGGELRGDGSAGRRWLRRSGRSERHGRRLGARGDRCARAAGADPRAGQRADHGRRLRRPARRAARARRSRRACRARRLLRPDWRRRATSAARSSRAISACATTTLVAEQALDLYPTGRDHPRGGRALLCCAARRGRLGAVGAASGLRASRCPDYDAAQLEVLRIAVVEGRHALRVGRHDRQHRRRPRARRLRLLGLRLARLQGLGAAMGARDPRPHRRPAGRRDPKSASASACATWRPATCCSSAPPAFTRRSRRSNVIHEGIALGDQWAINSSGQGVEVVPLTCGWLHQASPGRGGCCIAAPRRCDLLVQKPVRSSSCARL